MTAYYNEIDPFAAQWLRNLIAGGHIAPGEVDEWSIEDVTPDDLRGFTQCHFFAGIGVWSHALRLAGWPDNKPIWTGSCPCQPFSATGKGSGFDDDRHLWPAFGWLIKQCRPERVFGEQVAGGRADPWFDLVQNDVERMGYAFGITPFPASGIGAPNERERAYWVANSDCGGFYWRSETTRHEERSSARPPVGSSISGPLEVNGFWRDADWLLCRDGKWRPVESGTFPLVARFAKSLGHGKSSLRAMAGRNRTGRLKGYGNAINAQAAAEFIRAYMKVSSP
ncbi:DNA cytosine methyltransferase [Salmonella enterica subsp. enterica]|nr:DNA cytosine methyltransferase [Salmonella enterica subsp. enterica]EFU6704902.1 DNA cytosine methyltransferase [Salmonella enterica]EHC3436059.1 DNA cytosine methyltransferase [Salmonella enterica subsp. enterica serovar Ouakam]EDT8815073.1 DNA cytosine methyltransferase [Salmonella enterica subsp. enterica]EDV5683849.1 DNA cytosine methyltransferase [Salmonella enterica subsp. enterica]